MTTKNKAMLIDTILTLAMMFGVIPLVIILVWNVLVTQLFPIESIGYGGAWALIMIRELFFGKSNYEKKEPEEALKETYLAIFKAVFTVIGTLIVGYFIGAL